MLTKPKFVLSNTSTFFSGNIESAFQKADRCGFRYLEIVSYRWLDPEKTAKLSDQYQIQIAGVHMPQWWKKEDRASSFTEYVFNHIWRFYLGAGKTNPGLALAEKLQTKNLAPYLLFHANLAHEMGMENLQNFCRRLPVVIENLPCQPNCPRFFYDPVEIKKELESAKVPFGIVFDPSHYQTAARHINLPDPVSIYEKITPRIVHIGYDHDLVPHTLPNEKDLADLKKMFQIAIPEYIVIETNPLTDPKKARELVESVLPN